MRDYICRLCPFETDDYAKLIHHFIQEHPEENVTYRQIELNPSSGVAAYRSKTILVHKSQHLALSSENRLIKKRKCSEEQPIDVGTDCPENKTTNTLYNENTESGEKHLSRHSDFLEQTEMAKTVQESENTNKTKCEYTDSAETAITEQGDIAELTKAFPAVIEALKEHGQLELYKKWINLVTSNQFPMENICYLLFLDVVEWFSKPGTNQMRYLQEKTLNFWRVGYRLFHGKFLRFMNGPRSIGQIVSGQQDIGECASGDSNINFAIPSRHMLAKESIPPIFPGLLLENMETLATHFGSKPLKIGVDGKRISRGKGKKMGDIDCWGFETSPTLSERRRRLENETILLSELYEKIDNLENDNLLVENYTNIEKSLRETLKVIGKRIKDLRDNNVKLNQGIEKFMKMADSENKTWKSSRYAPVISSLKVSKFDTDIAIEDALQLVSKVLGIMSKMNSKGNHFSKTGQVDLCQQTNYNQLKPDNDPSNTKYIKQRTDCWHEVRNTARVTGSTCYRAAGLGKLKELQEHFDHVMSGKPKTSFTEQQVKNMQYGTKHEIDGIATIVGTVLPALFPELQYFEEGCMKLPSGECSAFMVVSPDGSLRENADKEPTMMYENKCKTSNPYTTDVYYTIPIYYLAQLLCEMKAYSCACLLFSCWSPQSTTVFKVKFDQNVWTFLWKCLEDIYTVSEKPKRFPENVKHLRKMLIEFQTKNVEFIAEVPSCEALRVPVDEVGHENSSC